MNDNEITMLLKEDAQKGFEAVIRKYSAYVMKIARTRLIEVCSREDIEEAVSDIFLKFYYAVKERSFDIPSVKGLLAVIAQRHCTDVFRRQSKCEEMLDYNELENIIYDTESTDDESRLIDALKRLGETDCNIFVRKYYFGQKNKEIAEELGIPLGTLNSRISRGLEKLRRILEEGKK
ncbi:MAG: RNA polymerase sigma factor [Ruminococcus sp.]|nr:RNA polymerase sigma factor [Ruminococcus sp.]